MAPERLHFNGFSIQPEPGWDDLTDTDARPADPITIANAQDGIGAFQITIAKYVSGPEPKASIETLTGMLDEFAVAHKLGDGFDVVVVSGIIAVAGKCYRVENEFIRVWYVSNGRNFALMTYVCDWDKRNRERSEVEAMVASCEFD